MKLLRSNSVAVVQARLREVQAKLHTPSLPSLLSALSPLLIHLPKDTAVWTEVQAVTVAAFSAVNALDLSSRKLALLELTEIAEFCEDDSVTADINDALGMVYLQEDNVQAAIACFRRAMDAIEEAKCRVEPYIHLSETYMRVKNWKQAIRYASQALVLAETQLKAAFPGTPEYVSTRSLLLGLYKVLSECEDCLNRPFQAQFWLRKSLLCLNLPEPEDRRHCTSPDPSTPRDEPMLLPSTSGESFDNWSPKPLMSKSGSQFSYNTMENYYWSRDSRESSFDLGGRPVVGRDSIQPEDFLALLTTSSARQSRSPTSVPRKSSDSESKRHVSLKIRSRVHTAGSAASDTNVIHQDWRKLLNGVFARVRLATAGEDWVLSVHSNEPKLLDAKMHIGAEHEWRKVKPEELVSTVELTSSGKFFLPSSDSPPRHSLSSSKLIRIYEEKKQFQGLPYSIDYSTDETMTEVKITAKTKGVTMRKVVVNDIELKSRGEVLNYVKEVLAPQVEIVGDKIKVRTVKNAQSDGNPESMDIIYSALAPSYPYPITIYRPRVPYLNWLITSQTPQKLMQIDITDREVSELVKTTDPAHCGAALANLVCVENGGRLGLKSRKFLSGVQINIVDVGNVGEKEYVRHKFCREERRRKEAESIYDHAAEVIQRFAKRVSAKRKAALLKNHKAVKARFIVKAPGTAVVVTVSQQSKDTVKIDKFDVQTKSSQSVIKPLSSLDTSSAESLKRSAMQLLSQPSRLLTHREQVIKGQRYLLSFYSQEGKVEIHAVKLPC